MDEVSFLVLSPQGSSRVLFDNGHSHDVDSAKVGEVKMFGHRETTPLVSCVVTETLHGCRRLFFWLPDNERRRHYVESKR